MKPNIIFIVSITASLALFIIYTACIEPLQVTITHREINHPVLASLLSNKIIVQLSDLHIKEIGSREKKVLALIDRIKPDIIFLTGDYVSWRGEYQPTLDFLSHLQARIGIWGVLGESDLRNSRHSCLFCHNAGSTAKNSRLKIKFLDNSYDEIMIDNRAIIIGGINDDISEEPNRVKLRNQLNRALPTLLLTHNPLVFRKIEPEAGVVMLAGDTHGGQVPLPSFVWQILGYEKTAVYPYGLFRNGKNILSVSSGIGTSHLPFRFMRKPEVVLYRFTGSDGARYNPQH